jgi:hypothetical protein
MKRVDTPIDAPKAEVQPSTVSAPSLEAIQAAELFLQQHLLNRGQTFSNTQRQRPFFNRAHPFLQQIIAELIKDAPAIIQDIINILNGGTPVTP